MTKRTKKLGEGQEMDLERVKKNYIRDWGPCDCGSEDFDFTAIGKKVLGLPVCRAKCKNCGAEWDLMGILDDKIQKIDKDTEAVIKLLENWAANNSHPDEPALFVPDGHTGGVSPRRLLEEIKQGTIFGKGQLASMVETYKELGLSKHSSLFKEAL